MSIPKDHPRYRSLATRDILVKGWEDGLVATQGLIAHGRGEAFDYLLGELSTEEARNAERIAAAALVLAERPVISVNGNVGALVPTQISQLSKALQCPVEVSIFHRTEERVRRLAETLRGEGCEVVLGEGPDARIPGLEHARALCSSIGIHRADVVLVPLEDGDRCQALKAMGKSVITIDLNPLSRTAKTSDIAIVDNITRAVSGITRYVRIFQEEISTGSSKKEDLESLVSGFSNEENLKRTLERIAGNYLRGEYRQDRS